MVPVVGLRSTNLFIMYDQLWLMGIVYDGKYEQAGILKPCKSTSSSNHGGVSSSYLLHIAIE